MKAAYEREFIRTTTTKKHYWRVREKHGEIVADGGEGYSRRIDAEKEFDKLFSVQDVQAIHELAELLVIELRVESKKNVSVRMYLNSLIETAEKIRGNIDRSKPV